MKVFGSRRARLFLLKTFIGLIGLVLSVVLHELFHIAMHWGEITGVEIFPSSHVIVRIDVPLPADYNLLREEAVAYSITLLVMLATAIIIARVHDKADEKSCSQLLFPDDPHPRELIEIAYRSRLLQ